MINYLLYGFIMGLAGAGLNRPYQGINIIRFTLLAIVGAMIGKVFADFLFQTYNFSSHSVEAWSIILGSISIMAVRKALFPKHRRILLLPPPRKFAVS